MRLTRLPLPTCHSQSVHCLVTKPQQRDPMGAARSNPNQTAQQHATKLPKVAVAQHTAEQEMRKEA